MRRQLIALSLVFAAVAGSAAAQSPPPAVFPTVDPHRYQVDRHRYEMDRLRAQADQREAFAQQLRIESRLVRQELDAARLTQPLSEPSTATLRSPEQERARRQSATERRAATVSAVSEIDAWLDRTRD